MEYTHFWGTHTHWFWIIPFLFMILMFLFAAPMMRRMCGWRSGPSYRASWRSSCCRQPRQESMAQWTSETPRQILDRRYANGDITKEEFEQMKNEIESEGEGQ